MKTLNDWLKQLESRYQYAPIQLGLERVERIATRLGVKTVPPETTIILVAGTNGKGSTVRALESIYLAAGYRVGAYTSPHLLTFNERIRWNGHAIQDEVLCAAFCRVEAAEEADRLTYFEFTTLAALIFFKEMSAQLLILEVGMGGRLDATNCIDPHLSIITTIDFDHQAHLGNTLEQIGEEKAGILRPNRPFIFGSHPVPQSVRNREQQLQAKGFYWGIDFGKEKPPPSRLHPQAVMAAWKATELLSDRLPIEEHCLQAALSASLMGRLQIIAPGIVVDVAHNVQSVKRLSEWLMETYPHCKIRAVFSALSDKEITRMIACMESVVMWYVAPLQVKRAATEVGLRRAFQTIPSAHVLWYNNVLFAFANAKNQVKADEVIVVFGSFFTVAEILNRGSHEISNG